MDEIQRIIKESIIQAWKDKGHQLTGAFENSISFEIKNIGLLVILEVWGNTYSKYMDKGVLASQIKYKFARARIEGLTRYAELRMGLSGKSARSAAYAMATKHAKYGMPLRTKGQGTHFLDEALKNIEQPLFVKLTDYFVNLSNIDMINMFEKYESEKIRIN
jgi:hypothetical protein